mmetsp:Transcript_12803/g.15898  ORF Transcript_12803/g.15898 Transcript_12803/m.15898 type:complete len:96 (+) Transcript_12803:313-600(+)
MDTESFKSSGREGIEAGATGALGNSSTGMMDKRSLHAITKRSLTPTLDLVGSDSKPEFADNSSTMLPEHCVLLAPGRGKLATSDNGTSLNAPNNN